MEQEQSFESLLQKHHIVVERYINYRLPNSFDADDVIQETYLAACLGFDKLKDQKLFKTWILSIARNQCNLWYRKKYGNTVISTDVISEIAVNILYKDDTLTTLLKQLPQESSEVLFLTAQGYKQKEIATRLEIPVGTVKSRLFHAKKQFRSICTQDQIRMFEKGRNKMAKQANNIISILIFLFLIDTINPTCYQFAHILYRTVNGPGHNKKLLHILRVFFLRNRYCIQHRRHSDGNHRTSQAFFI